MMMKCPIETQDHAELLLEYCARKLDPVTTAVLERHIENCAACRAFEESQRAVWEALDAWTGMPVSADFDRRLYRRIDEQARGRWWNRVAPALRPMLIRPGLPVAAAACLMVLAGMILNRSADLAGPSSNAELRMQTVQADQVERVLDDLDLLEEFGQAVDTESRSSI
jgi:anti-sigma factor RsiW